MSDDLIVSREAFVRSMVAAGVAPEKAEAEAERRYPTPVTELEADLKALEKAEQHEVVKLYRAYGCYVRNLSQARATKQSPGFPDLYIHCRRIRHAWWHETKRQGWMLKDLRPDQVVFKEDCEACDEDHVVGDRFAAAEQLVTLGLAVRVPGGIAPARSLTPA